MKNDKPNIFVYHDYRSYLKDRVEFEKKVRSRFSLRSLASQVQVGAGYLPMILSGQRSASVEVLTRVGEALGLNKEELKYLQGLRTISESSSQSVRLEALEGLQKNRGYREQNPRELEVKQYLTQWFNVVIREMVNMEGFVLDAKWIREHLRVKVSLVEIQRALDFLIDKGFIEKLTHNKARVSKKTLQCTGSVYRVVLSQFSREMLKLASESLDSVPYEERSITGLTMAIPSTKYEAVTKILDEALDRIDALSDGGKDSDAVYHVGIALFPLTKKRDKT